MAHSSLANRGCRGLRGVGLGTIGCGLLLTVLLVALHISCLEGAFGVGNLVMGHVFVAAEIGTFEGTLRGDDT